MKDIELDVSTEVKLNTLAKSIYNESLEMGFKSNDYVRLMNEILDMTITSKPTSPKNNSNNTDNNIKITDLPIKTEHLIIRPYSSIIDEKYVSKWFDDENNKLFLLSTTTKNDLNVENIVSDQNNIFATITLKNEEPIGLLALLNIDKENNKGEMRKMLGEISQRGKGYAKEASKYWLKYCTDFLGLKKIYINTVETNIKNITLNRQLGFQIEGLFKKECIINEVEHDVLRMAYFKES